MVVEVNEKFEKARRAKILIKLKTHFRSRKKCEIVY